MIDSIKSVSSFGRFVKEVDTSKRTIKRIFLFGNRFLLFIMYLQVGV
jgi:hypothetical protein